MMEAALSKSGLSVMILYLWLVVAEWPIFLNAQNQQDRQKQVLVLYSTRRDADLSIIGDREFPLLVSKRLEGKLDYYAEYLDLPRSSDPQYEKSFQKFLRIKYSNQQFDAVVAVQDPALSFVKKHREELFPRTPVIFLAQDPFGGHLRNSTGFLGEPDLTLSIALAVKLQPEVRKVFVVTGASSRDKYYENLARKQLESSLPHHLTFSYLAGLRTTDLMQVLRTLPSESIVYYLIVYQDGSGENVHPLEYLDRISSVANRPIYSWTESTMNRGIVGGSLRSQKSQIDALASLTVRVLNGEPVDSIPVRVLSLSTPKVDWRQLQRWKIDEKLIPVGTSVLYRNPTLWDLYKMYIFGAVALVLIEAGLIAGLLFQRRRKRLAEEQGRKDREDLHVSYSRLRELGGRLINAHETERSRIARELHDDVCQRLALLACDLQRLDGSSSGHLQLMELSSTAQEIASSVRTMSHELHPAKLRLLGLVPSLNSLCQEHSASGAVVSFSYQDVPKHVPDDLSLALFRVAQEGVRNALEHGQAQNISLQLAARCNELTLLIVDDGIGFDIAAIQVTGLGLLSMRERLEQFRGKLTIASERGRGTRLEATVWTSKATGLPNLPENAAEAALSSQ